MQQMDYIDTFIKHYSYFLQHIEDGRAFPYEKMRVSGERRTIAKLFLSSGKLNISGVVNFHSCLPILKLIPEGIYDVRFLLFNVLEREDQRIGFSEIIFSENEISKWLPVQIPFTDKDGTISYSEFVSIDGGDIIYCDEIYKTTLQERLEEEFEEIIVDSHNANQKLSWRHIQLPQSTPQVIIFSAGIGDGSYPSYLGYDMDGNVCRLVSDFKLYRYFV